MGFNDPNNDGTVTVQREVGDYKIVLTIFGIQNLATLTLKIGKMNGMVLIDLYYWLA
jgi:hypothetical protein